MKLEELAAVVDGQCQGDGEIEITGMGTLQSAGAGEITFLSNSKLKSQLQACNAAAVILRQEDCSVWDGAAIVCGDPHAAYAQIARVLDSTPRQEPGIHPSAVISDHATVGELVSIGANCVVEADVEIGAGVVLGPGCVIGQGAQLGQDSRLTANVTVCHRVQIGKRCVVQSGTVLGSDGFGNSHEDGQWTRIPQLGGLIVGDDVQIGAGTAIDRGALGDTKIGNGVVIDNLVHIAHNVVIGEHTAIAACVAIAGSTVIGSRCTLAGIVGVADHVTIADDVHLTGMAMVTGSISEAGTYSSGTGLMPNREWRRSAVRFRQLDELVKRLVALEQKIPG